MDGSPPGGPCSTKTALSAMSLNATSRRPG